jgi:hypothetical protein
VGGGVWGVGGWGWWWLLVWGGLGLWVVWGCGVRGSRVAAKGVIGISTNEPFVSTLAHITERKETVGEIFRGGPPPAE